MEKEDFETALIIAEKIFIKYFENKDLCIRLTLWDIADESILLNPILSPLNKFIKFKKIDDGSLVCIF